LKCEGAVSVRVTEEQNKTVLGRYRSDLVGVQTRSTGLYLFLRMKKMKITNYGQVIFTTENLMSSYKSKIHY
jgi:hypothetical protein